MKRTRWLITLLVGVTALLCWSVVGGLADKEEATKGDKEATEEASFDYVGAKGCMCHKKEAGGNQVGIWSERRHSKAFETLASEKAMAMAKEHKIEKPQEAPECLKCHATAFAVMDDLENQKITLEEGVSCESCHGLGSEYKSNKNMKAVFAGEIEGESVGLRTITEETCLGCHDPENPLTAEEFDYEKALATVQHPFPEEYVKEKKAK